MKPLVTPSLLPFFLVLFLSCGKDASNSNTKQEKIQAVVDEVRKHLSDTVGFDIPSLSLLIQTPSDKIFASSTAPTTQQITADTHFRFASNTKNFTAAAILNMWEDGWLDYKDNITDPIPGSSDQTYIPSAPDWAFPNRAEITIEQLLQHSAGVYDIDNDTVPGYGGNSYVDHIKATDPTHQFSVAEMVQVLNQNNLVYFTPGTRYHYSNTGFALLSEIVKRVYSYRSGAAKTYGDYIRDYITGTAAPVPLRNVHFPDLAGDAALPAPYVISTVLSSTGTRNYDRLNMSAHVGEGNGWGTMEDLNTYVRTLMKGTNVLQPASIQKMQESVSADNKSYALGCAYWQNLGYGHNGAIAGYLSVMVYDPEQDISLVAMTPFWDLRNGFASVRTCLDALYDAGYKARKALGFPGRP